MSVLPVGMAGASSSYSITNSIRLNGTSDYLSRTLTTSATTSGAVWVKRSKLGATSPIFDNKVYFTSGDALYAFGLTSTALYRDPSAWMHIFWNGTGVYVNGTLVTGSGTYTAASVTNPRLGYDGTNYFSGYLSDFAFWNGSSTSLQGGATDANGVWAAKRPSAGYSFLAFGSSGALGTDTSGNGNNWTVSGSPVQTTDTPTNNYCTLNPLAKASQVSVSNGNTTALHGTFGSNGGIQGSIAVSSGKWYDEVRMDTGPSPTFVIGFSTTSVPMGGTFPFSSASAWGYDSASGNKVNSGSFTAYGSASAITDVVMRAIDLDNGKVWFGKNGVWFNSGDPAAGTNPAFSSVSGYIVSCDSNGSGAATATVTTNCGSTAFAYTAPTGFKALCTANLPAVSITNPRKGHDVLLWTGTGATKTITGLAFQPDIVKIKRRDAGGDWLVYDSTRGAQTHSTYTNANTPASAAPTAEVTSDGGLTSFNSDGFTLGTLATANANGGSYVAYCWKKGAAYGLDIVTWTGDGTTNRNISHALGAIPAYCEAYTRSASAHVWAHHQKMTGADYYVGLDNQYQSVQSNSNSMFGTGNWTSTQFMVSHNATNSLNANGVTYVAYLWAAIPGFSSFSGYTSNGSVDGPFSYTGMQPETFMVLSGGPTLGYGPTIQDAARNPNNPANIANTTQGPQSGAESTGYSRDFVANGLKYRASDGNNTGSEIEFTCFWAKYPFGGSNIAPSPAR